MSTVRARKKTIITEEVVGRRPKKIGGPRNKRERLIFAIEALRVEIEVAFYAFDKAVAEFTRAPQRRRRR